MAPHDGSSNPALRAGTRISRLARTQTDSVIELLRNRFPEYRFESRQFSTRGDVDITSPLPTIGGKGLFTERLEQALREGEIDFAVHSLKDLPVEQAEGLTLGAVLGRTNPADVLASRDGWTLESMPSGARIGTSSTRRQAQILARRPDLQVVSIRGNVETRVRKMVDGEYDAVVLAAAGLTRLSIDDDDSFRIEPIPFESMLPAPGQGALAVQCRVDDEHTRDILRSIDDAVLRACVDAERTFLQELGGGCSAPIAALAVPDTLSALPPSLRLRGRVADPVHGKTIEVEGSGIDPVELGTRLAKQVLESGAGKILGEGSTPDESVGESRRSGLSGRRIVVTRAASQAMDITGDLTARGAVVLPAPAIAVVSEKSDAIQAALDAIEQFQWIAFASTNGVAHFPSARATSLADGSHPMHGLSDGGASRQRIAAVGPSTRAELERRGFTVDFVPSAFTSANLGRELPVRAGEKVLYITARDGSHDAERELAARGAEVVRVAVYRTESAVLSDEHLANLTSGMDAILFTSGSTVRGFHGMLDEHPELRDAFRRDDPVIFCIGPSTAETARSFGFRVDSVAAEQTAHGLVLALETYYGDTGDGT